MRILVSILFLSFFSTGCSAATVVETRAEVTQSPSSDLIYEQEYIEVIRDYIDETRRWSVADYRVKFSRTDGNKIYFFIYFNPKLLRKGERKSFTLVIDVKSRRIIEELKWQ